MVNVGLLLLLVLMTLLLVMFIGAVIVAPVQAPGSGTPHTSHAIAPPLDLPGRPPPAPPTRPLRHQPPAPAPTAGFHGWSGADQETSELGALRPMMHDRVPRPEVSGRPPWEPAPKPPGLEGISS